MSPSKGITFSPTMKRLLSSLRSNNKQPKRRDFIAENLNLAQLTKDQNNHLEAGHSIRHYSSNDEITEQKQPFELEAKDTLHAKKTIQDFTDYNKPSFEREGRFNFEYSTKPEDPITGNQRQQNTFSPQPSEPFRSFNQQDFYSRESQNNPIELPEYFNNQSQFERKFDRYSFKNLKLTTRKDQNEIPQDRTNGEQEAGEEGGSRSPFSEGINRQSFRHIPREYDVRLSMKPSGFGRGRLFDYGYTRIYDASHDGTKKEVFEDGAIRIDYNGDFLNENRLEFSDVFGFSWGPLASIKIGNVEAQVNATHITTGESIDLGSYTLDLSEDRFLVDLNGKIDAAESLFDRRSKWNFNVNIDAVYGGFSKNIEDFDETLAMIDALELNTFDGDIEANTFNYYDMNVLEWVGSEYDSGIIYKGRGGTDELILNGIDSADIKSFNGETFSGMTDYTTIGKQAIYQGTAFDILSLKNGDEIYLQGIERITTEDNSYRIREAMSDSTKGQWNLNAMDAAGAWRFNKGSDKVKLVSLDTGLNDVAGSVTDAHDEISHVQNQSAKSNDSHGHRAMSVMAAKHDGENLAGIAPGSQLVAYNVGSDTFYESIEDAKDQRNCDERLVFQNAAWLTDASANWPSAEAMKTSLEETQEYAFFSIAAGNDWNKNTVWAAGQQPDDLIPDETTELDNIAIVGALEFTGTEEIDAITGGSLTNVTGIELADYSNAGDGLTMVAPTDSLSIDANGSVGNFSGTSCASPNLAGAAALVWSENLALTGVEIKDIIMTSAMDLGVPGSDSTYGAGTINAESAVRRSHALSVDHELASFYSNTDFLA
ncbi:S8 family peptidase [Synechococcus sp. MIT S9503]|uniref:S8 family peptidase n=1 Tax=Synechococcus sp. MIT S9503 TaxID=3082547 RepID=UPI0039A5783B